MKKKEQKEMTSFILRISKEELAEAKEKAYAEIDRLLTHIDKTINESNNDYLVDDNFGPADAYLFVLTNWSNHIEHDLTPYKNIIALRHKVAERQSVQIAMRDEGLIA